MGGIGAIGGGKSNAMSKKQLSSNDAQNAATVATQIQADAQKQQMSRWKILEDTQTKIFEIQQDVAVNKAKTSDKMFQKWNGYITGQG